MLQLFRKNGKNHPENHNGKKSFSFFRRKVVTSEEFQQMVEKKAYELYLRRAPGKPGSAKEDWSEAERIVRSGLAKHRF
ncbi:MAG: DUF2934 domain-containing protein [Candidatus Omnitrophota bacterium]